VRNPADAGDPTALRLGDRCRAGRNL